VLLDSHAITADLASQPDTTATEADKTAPVDPANLASVTYTSDSAGQPKADAMSCAASINLLLWRQAALPIGSGTRALNFAWISWTHASGRKGVGCYSSIAAIANPGCGNR